MSKRADNLKSSKLGAAYHEAGHYVIARHFGIPVSAWLFIDEKSYEIDGKMKHFKMWLGNCQTVGRITLTDHQQRIHCVAGAIAEIAWERSTAEQYVPDWYEIDDYMSPSDHMLNDVECVFSDLPEREWQKWWKAMDDAHAMLNRANGPLWPTVQRVARRLLTSERNYVELNRRESNAAHERLAAHWARKSNPGKSRSMDRAASVPKGSDNA